MRDHKRVTRIAASEEDVLGKAAAAGAAPFDNHERAKFKLRVEMHVPITGLHAGGNS
jgi:hypothetical protein